MGVEERVSTPTMPLEPGARLGPYSAAVALMFALAMPGCSHAQPTQMPCSEEVQALASAALAYIVEARDLPDFQLLADDRPILVSSHIGGLTCELQDEILPASLALPMRLASPAQLQSAANVDGRAQYVDMSNARGFEGTQASLTIGVGMLLPEDSNQGLLCCCSARATFGKVGGTWVFTGWTSSVCA